MGAVLYVFMVHSVAIFDLHNLYLIDWPSHPIQISVCGVILISCILIGWVYSILGFYCSNCYRNADAYFSSFRLRVNNWFTRFLWVIDVAFRRSLNKHRRFLFWNLRLLNQEIHCSIFTLSYPLFICFISFCLKIVRDLVSHCGPPYDRYDRDIDIIYILYHYFYTRFLVKHLMS